MHGYMCIRKQNATRMRSLRKQHYSFSAAAPPHGALAGESLLQRIMVPPESALANKVCCEFTATAKTANCSHKNKRRTPAEIRFGRLARI